MTISKQVRVEALQQMIAKIAETVRDGYSCKFFDASMPGFTEFPGTTWSELEHVGILERDAVIGVCQYRIRPRGWIQILKATGELQKEETKRRAGKLAAAIKTFIVHGQQSQVVGTHEVLSMLANDGIPEDWVYCAIKSGLLNQLWPERNFNVEFARSERGRSTQDYLIVSGRFGMDDRGVLF